jgi:hypothetical protein
VRSTTRHVGFEEKVSMQRFRDLRRTHKKVWFGMWILTLASLLGAAEWFGVTDPIRTQVLGASVKSTPAPTITSGPSGSVSSTTATFTYSDSEKGVTFQCWLDSAAPSPCPSSGVTYNGLAQGSHTFWVRAQGISASPETTRVWTVDTVKPSAPVISSGPENPTIDTSATFVFTGEAEAKFECQLDADKAETCTPPFSKKKVSVSDHTFRVVTIDAAGNRSTPSAPWSWTVLINKAFGISGNAAGPLYPGAPATPLNLKISNPYNFAIRVVSITVTPAPSGSCAVGNLVVQDLAATHPTAIVVPANATATLDTLRGTSTWPSDWPTIAMRNGAGNQDVCKSRTFTLSYTGTATKS